MMSRFTSTLLMVMTTFLLHGARAETIYEHFSLAQDDVIAVTVSYVPRYFTADEGTSGTNRTPQLITEIWKLKPGKYQLSARYKSDGFSGTTTTKKTAEPWTGELQLTPVSVLVEEPAAESERALGPQRQESQPKGIVTDWVGKQGGPRIRAVLFPETFRLGEPTVVRLDFENPGSLTPDADLLEVNTELKANEGRYACVVQRTLSLEAVQTKSVCYLIVRPWGPIFGSADANAESGPGEISTTIHSKKTISAEDGSVSAPIDTWQLGPFHITVLPRAELSAATSLQTLELAAWITRLEHPDRGRAMWEVLAALVKPGMTVTQMKAVLPPVAAKADDDPREAVVFDGASFTIWYPLDTVFGVEASGVAKGDGPDQMVLSAVPRIKALNDLPRIRESVIGKKASKADHRRAKENEMPPGHPGTKLPGRQQADRSHPPSPLKDARQKAHESYACYDYATQNGLVLFHGTSSFRQGVSSQGSLRHQPCVQVPDLRPNCEFTPGADICLRRLCPIALGTH
jgi:hypothetical protein